MAIDVLLLIVGQAVNPAKDPTTWIYGGSALALLTLLISGIVKMQRSNAKWDEPFAALEGIVSRQSTEIDALNTRLDEANNRNEELARHIRECDYTVDLLIRSMQAAGVKVPADVFLRRRRISDD